MTPAEKKLWQALRGKKLGGLKFRRQHPVGPFVLDFYCPARKLVVELDGAVHDDAEQAALTVRNASHEVTPVGLRARRSVGLRVIHNSYRRGSAPGAAGVRRRAG